MEKINNAIEKIEQNPSDFVALRSAPKNIKLTEMVQLHG
jgi:hypothetical protein